MIMMNMMNKMDMSDIKGLCNARRALEIAVAGGHSVLLLGPAGCGRTMLAGRVATIMPAMSPEEDLELDRIYRDYGVVRVCGRPFYAPHHSASNSVMRRGCMLANHGVLFLDEVSKFMALDLRYVNDSVLIGADSVCPCGWFPYGRCSCTEDKRKKHLQNPNFQGFEIVVTMGPGDVSDQTESSAVIKERVEAAIARRMARGGRDLNLSVLDQVARTIADLAGSESVLDEHLREAGELVQRNWLT